MTDMYSFDSTIENCEKTYNLVADVYSKILTRIGLPFMRVVANSGEMGGSFSHEYHYQLPVGEDHIYTCQQCAHSFNGETLEDGAQCPTCSATMEKVQGIEIGHTFVLGDGYSKAFNANVVIGGKTVMILILNNGSIC